MSIQEPTPGYRAARKKQRLAAFKEHYDARRSRELKQNQAKDDSEFKEFLRRSGYLR